MLRYHKLARKNDIHVTQDIMTAEEAAAILMQMNLADNLINPMNRPDVVAGQPTILPSTRTPCVARNPPPENLYPMENFGELKNLGLHSNRPRPLPQSCTPTAMNNERAASRDWFAIKMDIDNTTASAKGETPNDDDRMDVNSTTQRQRRDQANTHHSNNNMVLRTIDNFAGAKLANNDRNQAEATTIEIEEEASTTKPKWRLCSYCGVPGHPIGKCPMVPCRRCHTVGHARNKCPLNPCKYCKMTGQHAIGQCPVVLAK